MGEKDIKEIAHLLRRAGFGATWGELERYTARGYEATVEELLDCDSPQSMSDHLTRRYHPEQSAMMGQVGPGSHWLYRMITTDAPLLEHMNLFWHGIFATGYAKTTQGKVLSDQIRMFGRYGMGSFKTLLGELAKDPAMIIWLDNQDNHKAAINENFGRELLELFSMGVGNYTEEDIKECARAFTGWTIGNTEYMEVRARRDSIWPYGRIAWHFEYRPEDHDDGEKVFLGHTGHFNGEDIIDIICQQPATARFIARHMYSFFVADEPPVPQWPYEPPRDPEAIEVLSQAYFDNDYDIRSMLRVLFASDFFRSESSWYEKVKSPAELVAGVLRLTGEFQRPKREMRDRNLTIAFMGQALVNPPSVEGWHQGLGWVDTGALVERVNFATQQLGNVSNPGVKGMIDNIVADDGEPISPESAVDRCLDQLGAISVSDDTRSVLVQFASKGGPIAADEQGRGQVAELLQLVASTSEFQRS